MDDDTTSFQIAEQILWCLGNLAGDSNLEIRSQLIHKHGIMEVMESVLEEEMRRMSPLLSTCLWCWSNILRIDHKEQETTTTSSSPYQLKSCQIMKLILEIISNLPNFSLGLHSHQQQQQKEEEEEEEENDENYFQNMTQDDKNMIWKIEEECWWCLSFGISSLLSGNNSSDLMMMGGDCEEMVDQIEELILFRMGRYSSKLCDILSYQANPSSSISSSSDLSFSPSSPHFKNQLKRQNEGENENIEELYERIILILIPLMRSLSSIYSVKSNHQNQNENENSSTNNQQMMNLLNQLLQLSHLLFHSPVTSTNKFINKNVILSSIFG